MVLSFCESVNQNSHLAYLQTVPLFLEESNSITDLAKFKISLLIFQMWKLKIYRLILERSNPSLHKICNYLNWPFILKILKSIFSSSKYPNEPYIKIFKLEPHFANSRILNQTPYCAIMEMVASFCNNQELPLILR